MKSLGRRIVHLAAVFSGFGLQATTQAALTRSVYGQQPPALRLPRRSTRAATGSEVRVRLASMNVTQREAMLWHELSAGNVPELLRTFVAVTRRVNIGGRERSVTFWCTPDYVGIGTDRDWFRMPMSAPLAQQVAALCACVLPTRTMVDAIWQHAALKLAPFPYSPAQYDIQSFALFFDHHNKIEGQRSGARSTLLTAGCKKDIVQSPLITAWPNRVVIYGWHYPDGRAIQPLSKVHAASYHDYSHGVRLVSRYVEVDGEPTTVEAVLADATLHPLLSDEGPSQAPRYASSGHASLPVHEGFGAASTRSPLWRHKFTTPTNVTVTPRGPSGDPTALRVMDPAGGTESLRCDVGLVRDVVFDADLLCEYRPEVAGQGFERVGIFVRDRATGAFDGTRSQLGACYALTFDSGDGRVRCLRVASAALVDLLPTARFYASTAWRRFRIEAIGSRIAFFVDGEEMVVATDNTHGEGAFGIGYHEFFQQDALMRGTRVDACHADVPAAFDLALAPVERGVIELQRLRGVPSDLYITVLTVVPGAYPSGWFFGLDPSLQDVLHQVGIPHPVFTGQLDSNGNAHARLGGLRVGLPLQGIALALDPALRTWTASPPRAVIVR